jgi:hypothetical protein
MMFHSWIVVMSTPKECRQNAEDCLRLAREDTTIYAREALPELAAEFREIAEQLKGRRRSAPKQRHRAQ